MIDALASYVHLARKLGFKPHNIIVTGDSAGGNLALALVRYLRDNPDLGLGMPGGLLLFSPWGDLTGTHYEFGSGRGPISAGKCDYLDFWSISRYSVGTYALKSLLGDMPLDAARKNPYITPSSLAMEPSAVGGLFTGFPPTYIVSGDAEALLDEIRILERRMSADMLEGELVYDEVADAIHDFVVFPIWEPERSNTFRKVAAWIRDLE
jgi:acetyl esterase/lipase